MNSVKDLLIDKNCKVIWQPITGELRLRHPRSGSYQLIAKAHLSQSIGDFIAQAIEEKIKREQKGDELKQL